MTSASVRRNELAARCTRDETAEPRRIPRMGRRNRLW